MRAPRILLALAVAAAGAWLLATDSHLTFIADDWELLVKRQGLGAHQLLAPYHENIVLAPALLYELWLAVFGMGSALPFYALSIGCFLAAAVALFAYLRRRVGEWGALIAAVALLFCGAAFEDLLWAFQLGYFGSALAGLGMLLALDRADERGDRIACALLVVSLAFSSVGLVFAAGALADLGLSKRSRARRAYVAVAPLALFALWWLGWGHTAQGHLSAHNLTHLPGFVFDAASAGIVSLAGLATGDGSEPSQSHLIWGRLALGALAALVALKIRREGRLTRGMAVALALGFAFWILAGANRDAERFPTSSRYQYPSALFVLLIAGEAMRGVRLPPRARGPALAAATVLLALALWGGISLLHREYTERWRPVADSLRSTLAAVELAGPAARPGFRIAFAPEPSASSRTYLEAVERYGGSPAWSEAELARRPPGERQGADLTLAQAERLRLVSPSAAQQEVACEELRASASGEALLSLLRGGFTLAARSSAPVEVLLGRFGDAPSVNLGPLPPGQGAALRIPADASRRPWVLGLRGAGPVRLCTTRSG